MLRHPQLKFLWAHQGEILDLYSSESGDRKDVAIELPTGSGKTLVGMLIAEYLRRTMEVQVAYLCPTRQLARQTLVRACDYGVAAVGLMGNKHKYDKADLAQFQAGQAVAVTTYSTIFNVSPGISDAEALICDDAHAGESYVASQWSLQVTSADEPVLFDALASFFRNEINPELLNVLKKSDVRDVDLIPLPAYADRLKQLGELLTEHCSRENNPDSFWRWQMLKGRLEACCVYVAPTSFLIRPILPPTDTHAPFANAQKRIYLSATLGDDGDLERMFGVRKVYRIHSEDLEGGNTGRRFIVFPHAMPEEAGQVFGSRTLEPGSRVLSITSGGGRHARRHTRLFKKNGFRVLKAKDVEDELSKFTDATGSAALVLTNRYDGIDLPGDTCRRIILAGLPNAVNLQEAFLRDRLSASSVMQNRIRVRLTQAMGRCTRDENDFALVVCETSDLAKWMTSGRNRAGLHPTLQAEIDFGLRQAEHIDVATAEEMLDAFFGQTDAWFEEADDEIKDLAKEKELRPSDVAEPLAAVVADEVDFVYALWRNDPMLAHEKAVRVCEKLDGVALKPYRAFWEYLAASAADLARRMANNDPTWKSTFQKHVKSAASLSNGVRWIAALQFIPGTPDQDSTERFGVRHVEDLLAEWGVRGRQFERNLSAARSDLGNTEAKAFHRGLVALGRMLGFAAKSYKSQAAPDVVWIADGAERMITFEAKSKENPDAGVAHKNVRQALLHVEWVKNNDKDVLPARLEHSVMVSPRTTIDKMAHQIAAEMRHLTLDEVHKLFEEAASVLNRVRVRAESLSEEEFRELIASAYAAAGLTGKQLQDRILGRRLAELAVVTGGTTTPND